jgi:tRNA (cmo5U34)-methyltransferase
MRQDEVVAIFDQQAAGYDAQWEGMAPVRDGLYFLLETVLAGLPDDARLLCVGVGTGAELAYLARKHPGWRFTAVEPSGPMLEVCRQRVEREGFKPRCVFHQGYLHSLHGDEGYDAATCLLVSQFILEPEARSGFFRAIAERLRPGGLLASADLASGADPGDFETLLRAWMRAMAGAGVSAERVEQARVAYQRDVAVLAPAAVASIIEAGGFERPVQFFQAGLLHAWCSRRPQGER